MKANHTIGETFSVHINDKGLEFKIHKIYVSTFKKKKAYFQMDKILRRVTKVIKMVRRIYERCSIFLVNRKC